MAGEKEEKREKAVEVKREEAKPDMFDEVFGIDEEKEKAQIKINEMVEEEKEKINRISELRKKYSKKQKAGKPGGEAGEKEAEEEKPAEEAGEEPEEGPGEEAEKEPEKMGEAGGEPARAEETGEEKTPGKKGEKPAEKEKKEKKKQEEKKGEKKPPEKKGMGETPAGEPVETVQFPQKEELKIKPALQFLGGEQGNESFIGRKKSVFEQYKDEAGLFIGEVEEEEFPKNKVLLDSLNPHVIFVCGARGSGKSYAMGVMAEELARNNKNVGVIVIDPVGVFWSMRFPNREKKEVEALGEWGLKPQGLDNICVFIPKGAKKQTPPGTYDDTFSVKPSILTAHDWCLTFGIDRFSPTGLLLEKALHKVRHGYKTTEGKKVQGKGNNYSLDDVNACLSSDAELNSRETGYKSDSIRALVSRFAAAESWGILGVEGTPLNHLSKGGQLTIIDTSFLDDIVTALVIGLLARRTLAARKISMRKEAATRLETARAEDIAEIEIPPTWMFIDEAHTLIPSGTIKTPATDALVEYVKQGRGPGCSIVFATQQPSAIDIKILSQLDIILCHKLVFNDDVKAVFKRMPSIIPHAYKTGNFIKTIPIGSCLVGDRREETSRAFVMKIRPRMSQHEGREAETVEVKKKLSNEKVLELIVGLYWGKLRRMHSVLLKDIEREVGDFNSRYSSSVALEQVVEALREKGGIFDEKHSRFILPEERQKPREEEVEVLAEEKEITEQGTEEAGKAKIPGEKVEAVPAAPSELLLSFAAKMGQKQARKLVLKNAKGKLLGLFGGEERIKDLRLTNVPIYKVEFNYFRDRNAFVQGVLFINSLSGEFLHHEKKSFVESSGLGELYSLSREEIILISYLKKKKPLGEIEKLVPYNERKMKRMLNSLVEKGLVEKEKKNSTEYFSWKMKFDLPSTPLHPLLSSIEKIPLSESDVLLRVKEKYSKKDASELLRKIWPKLVVKKIEEIYWPAYEGILEDDEGNTRSVLIDAVTGKRFSL